ncbi:single-stranded DNA-binding protein [Oceanobacillus caeni]|uniref:Single-stranded DNA-binding protein n=1 Tax=Oceanobacillus caeni TaxID=405946 RepID=A0ABR5MGN9_9BACI|nr:MULTISPECIES: single-stranded DNA-binding protein [Bacillaceae]KKE78303.1 single-stranded DNA-binding protein [Bacilli bacterium VT-13-104]PZD84895.1 single-stranded DNA-binding protein [Bacilli bacterium]KPH71795.1 single-stranded DNA-binding protein [Oceanobacillus caeni]MBU8790859.1 single-stranded DNA-binding protein [Oceanobacillus caeni]MCR1833710.1 single-stranded DNA-binding protein [Oceanobacillus caeni]
MLNRVVLVGRLTRDPDLRYTPTGVAVANFTLAVNRPFTNQQGNREADFINCVAWRRQAENLANYMKKGSMVGVDGRVQTRSYEGQDGKTVYVTEVLAESIQFLESRGSATGGQSASGFQPNQNQNQFQPNHNQFQPNQNQPNQNQPEDPFSNNGEPIDISDDDLPF